MPKKPTLDIHRQPMVFDERRTASKPQGSPTSHATPRNRALQMGTDAGGFEAPLTGSYSAQGGAPVSVLGRDFGAEQRIRDERQAVTEAQVGGTVRAGFRLAPYKAR